MCQDDWEIESLDVKTAFLYGQLDEEIYMEQPEGFKVPSSSNKVYRLLHALYGLKQAALAWNKELHKSLLKLNFKCSKSDPGVYIFQDKSGIMLFIVYVNDGLLMSNSAKLLKKKKTAFLNVWEAHDMGPVKEYLGFQITHNHVKRSMVLHQHPYVLKVLKRFQMENQTCPHTFTCWVSTIYSTKGLQCKSNSTTTVSICNRFTPICHAWHSSRHRLCHNQNVTVHGKSYRRTPPEGTSHSEVFGFNSKSCTSFFRRSFIIGLLF